MRRADAVKQFQTRAWIGASVVLAIAVIAWMWSREAQLGLVFGFMSAIAAGIIAYQPLAKLSKKVKQEYCSAIAEAIRGKGMAELVDREADEQHDGHDDRGRKKGFKTQAAPGVWGSRLS